jgi:hypothetical protein
MGIFQIAGMIGEGNAVTVERFRQLGIGSDLPALPQGDSFLIALHASVLLNKLK